MATLAKLARLPARDVLLLLRTGVLLVLVAVGLRLLPLRGLQALLRRRIRSRAAADPRDRRAPARLAWAVETAGRYRLGTCLSRALALQFLLSRHGLSSRLWLGVQRVDTRGGARARRLLRAHAWLEHDGRAVIGGPAPDGYTPLGCFQAGEVNSVRDVTGIRGSAA